MWNRVAEMTQQVRFLSRKCEDLSSIPRTHTKKWAMVVVSVLRISLLESGNRWILGAHWLASLNNNNKSNNNNEELLKKTSSTGNSIGNHTQAHKCIQA